MADPIWQIEIQKHSLMSILDGFWVDGCEFELKNQDFSTIQVA